MSYIISLPSPSPSPSSVVIIIIIIILLSSSVVIIRHHHPSSSSVVIINRHHHPSSLSVVHPLSYSLSSLSVVVIIRGIHCQNSRPISRNTSRPKPRLGHFI